MHAMNNNSDEFEGKGAVEQDKPRQQTNTSMTGQLGHRDQDPLVKANDSDYPEQGNSPEHSGEPEEGMLSDTRPVPSPEPERVDQDPGERQKRNQGGKKDDDLAA